MSSSSRLMSSCSANVTYDVHRILYDVSKFLYNNHQSGVRWTCQLTLLNAEGALMASICMGLRVTKVLFWSLHVPQNTRTVLSGSGLHTLHAACVLLSHIPNIVEIRMLHAARRLMAPIQLEQALSDLLSHTRRFGVWYLDDLQENNMTIKMTYTPPI